MCAQVSDLCLLSVAVQSVDNIYETTADLADQLSYFCFSRLGPFYGVRQYEGNAFQILKRYINNDEPNGRDFIIYLTGDAEFVYVCSNLYQICAALIDYLCRYKRYDVYSRKPYRYSLRKCPRCGRYFITEDRKIIYCKYVDESGKTCAEWQEIDRKKKFASTERTLAEQLAEKIRRRLYSYRTVVKISRADYTNDPRYKERDELYKLYTKCCKKHSQQSDFAGWVAECAAQLPTSRNESYDKFKEWLLERS